MSKIMSFGLSDQISNRPWFIASRTLKFSVVFLCFDARFSGFTQKFWKENLKLLLQSPFEFVFAVAIIDLCDNSSRLDVRLAFLVLIIFEKTFRKFRSDMFCQLLFQ